MISTRIASFAVAATAMTAIAAPGAHAAFPGVNGPIVYDDALSSGFRTVNADGSGRAEVLTGEGTRTDSARVSPNGALIAYSRGLDLWVAGIAGGAPQRVTTGQNNDQNAAFSPDGTKLVFRRVGEDDLFVVGLDGTGLRNLTGDGGAGQEYEPDWSPDGTRIAYQRDESAGQASIYVIPAAGGSPANLTPERPTPPTCETSHYDRSSEPVWSPDGSRIAFTGSSVCRGTESQYGKDIWVMGPDGGGKTNLVANDGPSEYEPHWSPDGTRIAFLSDQDDVEGPGDVYTMLPDGSGRTKVVDREVKGGEIDWGARAPAPTAPSLAVRAAKGGLAATLRRGLPITVRTDRAGRVAVRLRVAGRPVGKLSRNVAAGVTRVNARLSRRAAKRLRRARRVTFTARVTIRDASGMTATRSLRVTRRR